jgi:hypothetical protein
MLVVLTLGIYTFSHFNQIHSQLRTQFRWFASEIFHFLEFECPFIHLVEQLSIQILLHNNIYESKCEYVGLTVSRHYFSVGLEDFTNME